MSTNEVKESILVALESANEADLSSAHDGRVDVVNAHSNGETWQGVVKFANEPDYDSFEKLARSKNGVVLPCKTIPPQLQAIIDSAKVSLDEASAQYKVRFLSLNNFCMWQILRAYTLVSHDPTTGVSRRFSKA